MIFKNLFSTQIAGDDETARIQRMLSTTQTVLMGILVLAISMVLVIGEIASARGLVIGFVFILVTNWLNRRGHVMLAGFLFCLAMLGMVTYLLWVGQGIHDIAMVGYPLLLIFTSLLLNRRLYWLLAGLTILAAMLVILGEIYGFYTTGYRELTGFSDLVLVAALLLLAAFVVDLLAQSQLQNLARIRQVAAGQALLIEETRRRAEHLATLNRVGLAITSGLDLQRVLTALYKQMREVIQADTYYIALYDARSGVVSFPIFFDMGERLHTDPVYLHDEPGLTGEVILGRRTLYLTDAEDPETQAAHQVVTVGIALTRSFLGVPIMLREKVLGVLSVQSLEANAFRPDQISLLETIATQAAIAIQNARLYAALKEELNERRRIENALNQRDAILQAVSFAAQTFLTASDWREGIPEVLDRLGKSTGFTHVYIYENHSDPQGGMLTSLVYEWKEATGVTRNDNPLFQNLPVSDFRFPRWKNALENREAYYGSLSSLLPEEAERLKAVGLKSFLDVPIHTGEGWWGFLGFDDSEKEREWSKVTVGALETAANILSAAIQRQEADAEREQAEAAVRQLNAELEGRVYQRTAELVVANRELESFAYSVAHDLRSPLRGIDGYSKLLLDDYANRLEGDGAIYLENIRAAAQWMGQLIDDLLKLSRITRAEMRTIQVNLSALGYEALGEVRQQDPRRSVDVIIQPDLVVYGDPSLLGLAIENLLRNAWKFTSKTARARIELGRTDWMGKVVYFVRDNGAGFDMKYADKLFRPFQRLHNEEDFEGTGIGLATVQRIIQRHGGEIWAEAQPGEGATFFFTLPLPPSSASDSAVEIMAGVSNPQTPEVDV